MAPFGISVHNAKCPNYNAKCREGEKSPFGFRKLQWERTLNAEHSLPPVFRIYFSIGYEKFPLYL